MASIDARFDAYRSLAFGSISGSFAAVGSALTHLGRILHLVNNTNADMIFSFDGTTNNVYLPAGSFALYDFQANAEPNTVFFSSIGTQIYVKQASGAPTSGAVYAMLVYGRGQ